MSSAEPALVIRVAFRSGRVSEERGTLEDMVALVDQDSDQLIDHVLGLEIGGTELCLVHHPDDPRWEEFEF